MALTPTLFALGLPVVLFLTFWAISHYLIFAGVVRKVEGGAKDLARQAPRTGSYKPIFLVVAIGCLAAIGAGFLFMELAEQLRATTSVVNHIDAAVHDWFVHEREPAMTTVLRTATAIGSSTGLGLLVLAVAAVLLIRKERASAIFVIVAAATGGLLNMGLKMIFERARPDLALAITSSRWYSFPSGHAMGSFITFGALDYIALRQPWPRWARSAALAFAATMVVLIGLSRVYLGVHWASDIGGGWSAGTVWLAFSLVAFEMLLRQRQRRRGEAPTNPAADVPDKPVPARTARA